MKLPSAHPGPLQRGRAGRRRQIVVVLAACMSILASVGLTGVRAAESPSGSPASPASTGLAATPGEFRVWDCPGHGHAKCGAIQVPLDWQHPDDMAGAITVRFRIHPALDRSKPALEPVIAFEGGPGYGSIGSASGYRFMLGPLNRRHELIVMDQRGTGASEVIDCRRLQHDDSHYVQAVGACAKWLGDAAGAYGTTAAADDMAAILKALDIPKVDVYGDSYGTYISQTFALRHPDLVRAMVLDGTYDDSFDPFARDAAAAVHRSWPVLCRRARTCPGILGSIHRLTAQLKRHPLTGIGVNADGRRYHLRVTGEDLATIAYDGSYSFNIYRDLPGAIKALRHGDKTPFLRLAAEDLPGAIMGANAHGYSAGLYMAVSCHDYPVVWDPTAAPAERRQQLEAAIHELPPDAFAPFPKQAWLRSIYEYQLVYGCLRWPEPAASQPTKAPHSDLPVLVFNGQFDITTPMADAVMAAKAWPNATLVKVANEIHVSALYDYPRCASIIARHFIRTLDPGNTSCASKTPPLHVIERFPEELSAAPLARSAGGSDRSTAADRQAAWVANETVGDALSRWWNSMWGWTGVGLRGGTFNVAGGYMAFGQPLTLKFHRTQFVNDMWVSGKAVWHRQQARVRARLRVAGPSGTGGWINLSFSTDGHGDARVRGRLGGHPVRVRMPPPWSP